ncbi:MAG: AI-2E family transporter [Arenicellales bacterium]
MPNLDGFSPVSRALLVAASVVIVLAGVKAANSLIAPFLMAVFVVIIFAPSLMWLERKGVPHGLSVLIVLTVIGLFGAMIVAWLSNSLSELSSILPSYKIKLAVLYDQFRLWLGSWNINVPEMGALNILAPDRLVKMFNSLLNSLSGLVGDALIVFIAVLFLMVDIIHVPAKLRAVFKSPEESMPHLVKFSDTVIRYLALKSITSAITAGCVAIMLWYLDYDFIALWAVLAFLLNFIPYLGSALAGIAPVIIGLIDHGWLTALWAAVGYVAINIIVGQIIETRLIGSTLNLSSFVVFVSLTFWGWVLGPVGMFLSIPLTMLLLIGLQSSPRTRRYATLLMGA